MNGKRIRQVRLARGLSLDALAAQMGGIVSKQALSRYERGIMQPSPRVLAKLAAALGVRAMHLWAAPSAQVEFVAYRKGSGLPRREELRVQNALREQLETRMRLQELRGQLDRPLVPVKKLKVTQPADAETAAMHVREEWNLGLDPLASVVDVLEDHFVHVIEIEASESFDGIAAVAYGEEGKPIAAAVATRADVAGERQRLSVAHELGHLSLNVSKQLDEEAAAFRFASAFLAPAQTVLCETGPRRTSLQLEELLLLKQRFGMSMQALLHRLRDLDIVTEPYYKEWRTHINRAGWKKKEPLESEPEPPRWFTRNVLRAMSEGFIDRDEARTLLGEEVPGEEPLTLLRRRAFMRLPVDDRRRILAQQARTFETHYRRSSSTTDLETGDVVE